MGSRTSTFNLQAQKCREVKVNAGKSVSHLVTSTFRTQESHIFLFLSNHEKGTLLFALLHGISCEPDYVVTVVAIS